MREGTLRWPGKIARLVTAVTGDLVAAALAAAMFLLAALGGTSGSCIIGTSCATYGKPWLGMLFLGGSLTVVGVSLWCHVQLWRSTRPLPYAVTWAAFLAVMVVVTLHFGAAHVHRAGTHQGLAGKPGVSRR
jgi:hypothetical protein